ncbi:unnamed protein product [Rhizoctonia solani]|uniref:Uncharacterized protein n=1 Tax=Rhizoctonia solani TaxID=456999 RepID=A0A8H3E1Z9_9AGAM|nr:unnamed protein product [Rhizoctonia solani]
MVALGPPWTFAGVAGVDSRDLEYHHDSSPSSYFVQDDWYPLRSVQEAGFFHRPMYFVHGDDAQYVLCWSLSNGDTKNYIWCIDWDLKCEPILKLYQEFLNDESSWLKTGQYLFYPQPGSRGVWKAALKPNNLFSPFYVQVKLYSGFQPDWFKFGNDILIADSILPAAIQSPIQAQTDSTYCAASDYNSSSPDLSCIDPAAMSFGHISTPSSGNSDTLSDASADVSGSDASEAEMVTWGPGRFFCTNEAGEVVLILPNHLGSREAVKAFVSDALSSGEIDGVRHVKCSLCKNKKAAKLWEIKPSNLEVSLV